MASEIKLKVCGMRNASNIRQVAQLQPDYLGFILYAPSPRYVGEYFDLPKDLPPSIKRVGVFVNEATPVIIQHAEWLQLYSVQLHGDETPDQCRELKYAGYSVIKVFSVDDTFDFNVTKPYRTVVDYFLFDTKGKYYGGNAKTFNWSVLERYDQQVPFFLSGGLSADNVAEALAKLKGMNLYALDINSGVEITPGLKDVDKISLIRQYMEQTIVK